nr:hypothetical protein [Tanacetum cinerariifolium]
RRHRAPFGTAAAHGRRQCAAGDHFGPAGRAHRRASRSTGHGVAGAGQCQPGRQRRQPPAGQRRARRGCP